MKRIFLIFIAFGLIADSSAATEIDSVRARIHAWANAWQSKDIERYISFYSPAFRSGKLDYQQWLEKKKDLFQKPGYIYVEISDLWVSVEKNHADVSFIQYYHHTYRRDVGEKTIVLKKSSDGWKIVFEKWKALAGYKHESVGEAVAGDPGHDARPAPQGENHSRNELSADFSAGKLIVKKIGFTIEQPAEKVFIAFNQFAIPEFFTLEGDKPRIVIDVREIYSWNGQAKIPVNGALIKQIRTFLHKNENKLRIVLDLFAGRDYMVSQLYDMAGNLYSIEVKEVKNDS